MDTSRAIRERRTLKVLADPTQPRPECDAAFEGELREMLEIAGHAPFHYPADPGHREGALDSPVPWRFHVLPSSVCRALIPWSEATEVAIGKVNNMLAVAQACVLVTWLPDATADGATPGFQEFDPSRRNMEHIAAASSAVQNLLLVATDRDLPNYWSSGGYFRSEQAYAHLEIDPREILLGSIFLFPAEAENTDARPGKHRDTRGPLESWSRTVRP